MTYLYWSLLLVLCWAVVQSWRHQAKTLTVQPLKSFVHLLAWYLPYLFFPLLAMVLYAVYSYQLSVIAGVIWGLLLVLCIYARFIEPKTLRVQYHRYDGLLDKRNQSSSVKIVVLSDLHIGLFSGHRKQLENIVQRVNDIAPDMVLVIGDWTYEPYATLAEELQIFKQIQAPIYSVLGNHDEQCPGPPVRELLQQGLADANVIDVEGCIIEHEQFYLVGVGDLWAGKADMHLLPQCPDDKPYIIMAHNPDTIDLMPKLNSKVLMVSGHTHGGQVALPYITNFYLKRSSILGHREGWYQHEQAQLFVSVGTGMVGVPFRFLTPPTVDVIELI